MMNQQLEDKIDQDSRYWARLEAHLAGVPLSHEKHDYLHPDHALSKLYEPLERPIDRLYNCTCCPGMPQIWSDRAPNATALFQPDHSTSYTPRYFAFTHRQLLATADALEQDARDLRRMAAEFKANAEALTCTPLPDVSSEPDVLPEPLSPSAVP